MRATKYAILTVAAAAMLALAGCAGAATAAADGGVTGQGHGAFSENSQLASAGEDDGGGKDRGKDEKDKDDKGRPGFLRGSPGKGNPGTGNGNADRGAPAVGQANKAGGKDKEAKGQADKDKVSPPGQDMTGWQWGRFKDVLPFAYPAGWSVESGRDGLVLSGDWDDRDYVVEVSRALRVSGSFTEWLNDEVDELEIDEDEVEYGAAGRVQMAVVRGLDLEGYDCPVARAFLWTQNPAGRNQRVMSVKISQAEGDLCDQDALNALLVELAARVGEGDAVEVIATPRPTATPSSTGGSTGWQQTHIGPVRLPIPEGWTITSQGNTGIAQGQYEGRAYVVQAVPYASIQQDSLGDWVGSQADDLGLEDDAVEYVTVGGLRAAVIRNLDREDDLYRCPVTRGYVWLGGESTGTVSSGVIVTIAQMGLQPCDPAAMNRLVTDMLGQVQR
jgi:hypothetical protein